MIIYYLIPPFDPADIVVGPEAAEMNTLSGNFLTSVAYEINSFRGLTVRWNARTESYRFLCFTPEGEAKLLSLFEERLAPRGATLVKGRK